MERDNECHAKYDYLGDFAQALEQGQARRPKAAIAAQARWAIRTRLQMQRKMHDLALFNLAIDSKLRGCDVVSLKVEDIAPHGYTMERATVRQKKTGRPVRFELTEQTRQAVDEYLVWRKGCPGAFSLAAGAATKGA